MTVLFSRNGFDSGVNGVTSNNTGNSQISVGNGSNADINTATYTVSGKGTIAIIFGNVDVVPPGNAAGTFNLVIDGSTARSTTWHSESTNSRMPISVFYCTFLAPGSHTIKLHVTNDPGSSGSVTFEFGLGLEVDFLAL